MYKYAGMATQFLVTLAVTIFIALKADKFVGWKFPVFTVSLPVFVLFVSFWKIYKDTTRK